MKRVLLGVLLAAAMALATGCCCGGGGPFACDWCSSPMTPQPAPVYCQ